MLELFEDSGQQVGEGLMVSTVVEFNYVIDIFNRLELIMTFLFFNLVDEGYCAELRTFEIADDVFNLLSHAVPQLEFICPLSIHKRRDLTFLMVFSVKILKRARKFLLRSLVRDK